MVRGGAKRVESDKEKKWESEGSLRDREGKKSVYKRQERE